MSNRGAYELLIAVLIAFVVQWPRGSTAAPNAIEEQVCDPLADYFLGMEDYGEAIRRHRQVIKQHPDNALAHYHLGFAYGLRGEHGRELKEYQRAVDLGLSDWELFLNLGLLQLQAGHTGAATDVLTLATLLGPERPETHYNLALAYEQRGMLERAEQEMLLSLRLDPNQSDALNTLGVIYAEQGNYVRAREQWSELTENDPDYAPAQANLKLLDRVERDGHRTATRPGFAHEP